MALVIEVSTLFIDAAFVWIEGREKEEEWVIDTALLALKHFIAENSFFFLNIAPGITYLLLYIIRLPAVVIIILFSSTKCVATHSVPFHAFLFILEGNQCERATWLCSLFLFFLVG